MSESREVDEQQPGSGFSVVDRAGNDPIEIKYSQSVKDSHAVRGAFHLDFIACPRLSFATRFSRSAELSPNSRRESNHNEG